MRWKGMIRAPRAMGSITANELQRQSTVMSPRRVRGKGLLRLFFLAAFAELGIGASFAKRDLFAQTPPPALAQAPMNQAGPDTATADAQPPKPSRGSAPGTPIQVFQRACMKCHDADGKGEGSRETWPRIPDFTDGGWHRARTDAELCRSIVEGKGKSMPPMKAKLGTCSVQEMVAFIRAFRGGKQVVPEQAARKPERSRDDLAAFSSSDPAPTDPRHFHQASLTVEKGSRLFQQLCVKCHGSDGTGTDMRASLPTIPNFANPAWHTQRRDPQLVASILSGKGTAMPAFAGRVSEQDARALIAYVRGVNPARTAPAAAAPNDFESRFRQLEQEFGDLNEQMRKLSAKSKS